MNREPHLDHGLPGSAEPMPEQEPDEPIDVNDFEELDDEEGND